MGTGVTLRRRLAAWRELRKALGSRPAAPYGSPAQKARSVVLARRVERASFLAACNGFCAGDSDRPLRVGLPSDLQADQERRAALVTAISGLAATPANALACDALVQGLATLNATFRGARIAREAEVKVEVIAGEGRPGAKRDAASYAIAFTLADMFRARGQTVGVGTDKEAEGARKAGVPGIGSNVPGTPFCRALAAAYEAVGIDHHWLRPAKAARAWSDARAAEDAAEAALAEAWTDEGRAEAEKRLAEARAATDKARLAAREFAEPSWKKWDGSPAE